MTCELYCLVLTLYFDNFACAFMHIKIFPIYNYIKKAANNIFKNESFFFYCWELQNKSNICRFKNERVIIKNYIPKKANYEYNILFCFIFVWNSSNNSILTESFQMLCFHYKYSIIIITYSNLYVAYFFTFCFLQKKYSYLIII